ncbi:benzoate-CoA ligase family protein [Labedaea rhizosphaerae]|uniref:benzoate-CoA ligase family protein n=1 Tax=Labedaea rhizosphaerae TaxID=598644 RepID=UPI003C7E2B10
MPADVNLATYFVDRNVTEGRGDRTALVCDGASTTYAQLAVLVNRIGNVLRELGVRPGDRILIAASDSVEWVATWYAAQKIGAVTAEVYTFLQPKDYAYFLDYVDPKVVVVDGTTLANVREASSNRRLLVLGDHELVGDDHSFDAMVGAAPDTLDPAPVGPETEAVWKFTTGSTGAPKACVHPAGTPIVSYHAYARGVLDIDENDLVLPVPKLFFGYARDLTALYPFGVGGAGIVFGERSTPERLFELIAAHRPTILVSVPTMMAAMVAHPSAAEQDLSCLRLTTSAGEALPAELHRKWDKAFGVPVVDGIGSSEAYHIYVSNRPGQARPGTLGRVVPGYTARVVDDTGAERPVGELGPLAVTGPTVALRYHGDPEKSAATYHGDTVLSSDLFECDAEGYLSYRGRADDLLKVGGIWVAPSEIEHCLIGHDDVVDCAVLGYEVDGLTRPRAYVVVRDGATVTPKELQDYARAKLAGHKYPREVVFVDELPRTSNGKLDRRALRGLVS